MIYDTHTYIHLFVWYIEIYIYIIHVSIYAIIRWKSNQPKYRKMGFDRPKYTDVEVLGFVGKRELTNRMDRWIVSTPLLILYMLDTVSANKQPGPTRSSVIPSVGAIPRARHNCRIDPCWPSSPNSIYQIDFFGMIME